MCITHSKYAVVGKIDAEYWKEKNIEALVTGSIVQESDDIYRLSVNLFDVYSHTQLFLLL
jgi:Tol biopolymer transport system component